MDTNERIAVLIPCYNEAATIGKVVDDFRAALPEASIYVFDNCCTDQTAEIARQHNAIVLHEPRKGKGYVVEAMLDRVEADYFLMVDGDDTYPAERAKDLLKPVMNDEADMVVGARLSEFDHQSFRPLHVAGNGLVRKLINLIFGAELTDILSGYRAFNRRVASRIPVVSSGFEVETELTIQMLYYRLRIAEMQVAYRGRPEGSVSKLNTFSDGFRVLWKLFSLVRAFKPLTFFGGMGLILMAVGILTGIRPICGLTSGEHTQLPMLILSIGLIVLAFAFGFMGLILHAVNWRFKELHNIVIRRRF
jgi:glycosyltransferase involved in cell wall biosynthesis